MKILAANIADGHTEIYGLIGQGIQHTKSPALHNTAARLLGINAVYLAFDLDESQLDSFLKTAWELGWSGFNVTVPHKRAVAELIDSDGLKTVNTLYRGKDGWRGACTDGEGFTRGLRRIDCELAEIEDVIVLGNGGAVHALIAEFARCAEASQLKVTVMRRQDGCDQSLAEALGRDLRYVDWSVESLVRAVASSSSASLMIQGTSAPLRGNDLKDLIPALDGFQGCFVDLVYGTPSALYFAAVAKGITSQDGEAMLIEQARAAQKIWWRRAARYDDLADALRSK